MAPWFWNGSSEQPQGEPSLPQESIQQITKLLEQGLSKIGYDPLLFGKDAAENILGDYRYDVRRALVDLGICDFRLDNRTSRIVQIIFHKKQVLEVVTQRLIDEQGDSAAFRAASVPITSNEVARVLTAIFGETSVRVAEETERNREQFAKDLREGRIDPHVQSDQSRPIKI